ncbi:hypothetical protein MMC13_004893 [Lambiella insularis]|nr:hypothetical protein [Lambiella insularis]
MAFTLRQPFTFTAALKRAPQTLSISSRPFHHLTPAQRPAAFSLVKHTSPTPLPSRLQNAFKRTYMQPASPAAGPSAGNLTQRLLYGAGIVGGTILATNLLFNRETREDGGMPPFERSYLNETFAHTGLGVGIIGVAARALHHSGWSVRLMASNPWLVIGGGLAMSIGTMYGCFATSPDNYIPKYAFWTAFNVTQAAFLAPLMFMSPALLARAGLYTVAMMGSIAFVGATAKTDKYLYLGAPLLAGVAVVAVSGFAPLVLPATAVRTLMWTENIWLYGGLAVFGGFTLYDVQKVLHHARLAERGVMKRDAVNESISLELDFINIFIRMVQLLGMQQRKR